MLVIFRKLHKPYRTLIEETVMDENPIVKPKKLETGLGTISAEIPYTSLLRIEVIGIPTFGLLL